MDWQHARAVAGDQRCRIRAPADAAHADLPGWRLICGEGSADQHRIQRQRASCPYWLAPGRWLDAGPAQLSCTYLAPSLWAAEVRCGQRVLTPEYHQHSKCAQ